MGTFCMSEKEFAAFSDKKPKNQSKYHSRKIVVNGIEFDSELEGRRYAQLRLLERCGEIRDLQRQVPFVLIPTQREPGRVGKRGGVYPGKVIEQSVIYYADFVYTTRCGERVVEDTKGTRTPDYVIKRKLMLYIHKIRIKEVRSV